YGRGREGHLGGLGHRGSGLRDGAAAEKDLGVARGTDLMPAYPRVHQGNPAPMCFQDIPQRGGVEGRFHLTPFISMTHRRLLTAGGGLALAVLLAIGLVQLARRGGSDTVAPTVKLTAAQMRSQLAG